MNKNPGDHWRSSAGTAKPESQPPGRPYNTFDTFGPNGPSPSNHVLPPPPSGYHHQPQQLPSGGHSLSIADLTQGPPSQHQYNTQPPPPSQSHSIASLSNSLPHQSPQYMNRDRDIRDMRARDLRDHELREREMREREQRERSHIELQRQHQEDMMRERDRMDRMRNEQQAQQPPVQSHAGSIPIHQPVASKIQNTIHGPNGLLANGGTGPQPNGPGAGPQPGIFGMQSQHEPQRQPSFSHQPVGAPQSNAQAFIGGPSPLPAQAQLAHGQQPILNDALSYLDQVKVRFSDQPDVYNRFLDIMKDFKSQAIDTPGVIQRVSELFNGHPALIQGFNTFLPPGYRIECGTEENPDAIRVTTPSGTMTQSLQPRARPFESSILQSGINRTEPGDSRWGNQVSPGARNARLPYDQAQDRMTDHDSQQQDQRSVMQLQNAMTSAQEAINRQAITGSPAPGQPFAPASGEPVVSKRNNPVEFNHAISYVNKIKNRYAQQPEIYKQFLEILQTYQRESRPIQDVYSQVTQLFIAAPDLLEDFKQFLPEATGAAKAAASKRAKKATDEVLSDVRGEPGYETGQLAQAQTPRPTAKMPPMGQFDPPSTSKDNKKRRTGHGTNSAQTLQGQNAADYKSAVPAANVNKRQKISTQRPIQPEAAPVSPSLVPQLPEPLPPTPSTSTTQEELGFFDRTKKHIGNRATYTEFLKLINLYTQDLIDKYTLADRVASFIGNNADLMLYFKTFLGIEEHDEEVEARARPDPGRVNLSHCRAFGPSYRHLPKRDQNKTCKGRDGMCYEVLNDVWASHPTWASEDSGFVAHRKNQYEEALHRIEEERHDYDFHIESCQRTIQLMEPIVQQISVMDEASRKAFVLQRGIGGASEAIPKRIILKVYGREVGNKVLEDMYAKPTAVLPILLQRLKQKLEEWRHVQREWENMWREQTNKQFWKSLDHQGINAKNLDKKNFQQKTLTSEIQAKYEERKRDRSAGIWTKKHQLEYEFKDQAVLVDATQLVLTGLESEKSTFNSGEQARIKLWLQDFVSKFFGLDKDEFVEKVEAAMQVTTPEEMEEDLESDAAPASRSKAGRPGDWLRRAALEKRNGKTESVASASKESTPVPSGVDMDLDEENAAEPATRERRQSWINVKHADSSARQMAMDDPYKHTTFNLYANANIYCFFRLFEMLYTRLMGVKSHETSVLDDITRWKGYNGKQKAALSLKMIDKEPTDFFKDVSGSRTYYSQVLEMCNDVLLGRIELSHLEETLRRYYNKTGWQLYTIDKLVAAILRFVMNILGGDAKDKSVEITNLFFRDREKPDTTRKQEIQYRKQVEKLSKDGEVYRISYVANEQVCTIRLFPSDDATFDSDQLNDDARWQYYVASFTMTDATEGIDQTRMRPTFLQRTIAAQNADIEAAYEEVFGSIDQIEEQSAFISPDTYKMYLSGDFGFVRQGSKAKKQYVTGRVEENESFKERFVRNVAWMKDQPAENVEARKAAWDKGLREGLYGFEDGLSG